MQITHGLFKGITPAEGEIRTIYDRSGAPVLRDGVPVQSFGVHQRTPYVLEKFSPLDGYAIEVVAEPGAFDLPDPDTMVPDGNDGVRMANQPTVKFTARLIDPNNRTLATASYLKVINSLSSHQEGETLARGRLYEALGLPGASHEVEAALPAAPKVTTVSAVAIGHGADRLPAMAQGIQEAAAPDAKADAMAEDADAAPTPVEATASAVPAPSEVDADAASQDVPSKPAVATVAPAAAAPSAPDSDPSVVARNGDALAPALVRQAIARARSKGVTLPAQFDSAEHLRLTYRDLCTRKTTPTTEEA